MSTHANPSAFHPNKGTINVSLELINEHSLGQRDKIVRYLHADALMKGTFEPGCDGDTKSGFHMLHYIMSPEHYLYAICEANTGTMVGFMVLDGCFQEDRRYKVACGLGPLVCEVFEVRTLSISAPSVPPIAVPLRTAPPLHSHDTNLCLSRSSTSTNARATARPRSRR